MIFHEEFFKMTSCNSLDEVRWSYQSPQLHFTYLLLPFISNDNKLLLQSMGQWCTDLAKQYPFLRKEIFWIWTEQVSASEMVIKIGAAAYNRPHITIYHQPQLFPVPLFCPLYFKMHVYHYLPSPVVWSTDIFVQPPPSRITYQSNALTSGAH